MPACLRLLDAGPTSAPLVIRYTTVNLHERIPMTAPPI